jgi:hypothetical protein
MVLLIVSTLFLKELWTLFPYDTETYKLFPYSETMMTKQTYIWFLCYYGIWLIILHSWYYKFVDYRIIFGVWFLFQIAEFVEFYFTYNEALYYLHFRQHKIGVNVTNIKYVVLIFLTGFQFLKDDSPKGKP